MSSEYKVDIRKLFLPFIKNGRKVFSVIGSGGKTSLIKAAAAAFCYDMKVGVAASARMYQPDASWNLEHIHVYADRLLENGKIAGISGDRLAYAIRENDLLLIEADGSAGRPLKGWASYEPVIIKETQVTICVLPAHLLGCTLKEEDLHRPAFFTGITGIGAGDVMDIAAYRKLIAGEDGLLGKGRGECVLLLSHCDDAVGAAKGRQIADAVRTACKQQGEKVPVIVYGSLL